MLSLVNNFVVVLSVLKALVFLFQKKIRSSSTWHATVTPLASIIGGGFFVSARQLSWQRGLLMLSVIFFGIAFE